MKTLKICRVSCVALVTMLCVQSAQSLPPQSNNGVMQAVPAPGAVTIDGELSPGEWDLTGRMLVYSAKQLIDRYSVKVYAMWDQQYLYLALDWQDPTPMYSLVDAVASPGDGWQSDCFQGRFETDRGQIHFTAYYSSYRDLNLIQFDYGAIHGSHETEVYRAEGTTMSDPSGLAQAFVKRSDDSGYMQEIRIPWALLKKNPTVGAGSEFGFSGEYFWGSSQGRKWPGAMYADPVNQKNPIRVVLYQNPANWGRMELLGEGNLVVEDIELGSELLQGPIPLRFKLPPEAVRFSIVIDDLDGNRVRNLLGNAKVSDYAVQETPDYTRLLVRWDGRADGIWDKNLNVFRGDVVEPGPYRIKLLYHDGLSVLHDGSFYNPGTPPWPVADGTGGWGFDHSPPLEVATMPVDYKGKTKAFLGWRSGEGGVGFIGLNDAGRKTWSFVKLGGGAQQIAGSSEAVYFVHHGELARLNPEKGTAIPFEGGHVWAKLGYEPQGMAIFGEQIAFAIPGQDRVEFYLAPKGQKWGEIPTEELLDLTYLPSGLLVGITRSGKLQTLNTKSGAKQQFAFDAGVKASKIATDRDGYIYIADSASSTIIVYEISGNKLKQVAVMGEAGGHKLGSWNEERIGSINSIDVKEFPDGRKHVWVVETEPVRRVSVWSMNDDAVKQGRFVRDFVGNTSYMGSGGNLSDDDPDLGLYKGIMMRIDRDNLDYEVIELMGGAPDPVEGKAAMPTIGVMDFGNGYLFESSVSGKQHEYYVESSANANRVYMRRGDRWLCVAALGNANIAGIPIPPAPNGNSVWSWNDDNGNGFVEGEEVVWHDVGRPNVLRGGWMYRCYDDLIWYHSGFAFKPVGFTKDGAPRYDVRQAEKLPGDAGEMTGIMYATQFGYVGNRQSPTIEGWPHNVIHGHHELTGFDQEGNQKWTYPNFWYNVHGAMSAPAPLPGVLMGVLNISGIVDNGGHDVVALRGNTGVEFLIRDDGLYVGSLFTDQRMMPSTLPPTEDCLGIPINDTTMGGECFQGFIARQRDGEVRMTYGYTDVRIAKVVGLNSIETMTFKPIKISPAMVAASKAYEFEAVANQKKEVVAIKRGAWPLDAGIFGDENALPILAGNNEVGLVRVSYDAEALHVAWQVFDSTPMVNKGMDPKTAFKSGDSVSLFVAPDGEYGNADLTGTRVLLTWLNGQPKAVIYRPAGPGNAPYTFSSPVRERLFEYVAVHPEVKMRQKTESASYIISASVPWKALGIKPKSGLTLKADFGLIEGRETTAKVSRRLQWADPETNVTDDTPTESEFFPARWGSMTLE